MAVTKRDPTAWIAAHAAAAVRAWAERAAAGEPVGPMTPNAVRAFCERHHIPLADRRLAARAILRSLASIASAQDTAP
jgi:hypothetical protein